jgi:S-adenosylmethionine synthetase
MSKIYLSEMCQPPMEHQQVELVERKGKGHPDTICDAIMEAVSVALCREYLATFGRVLHHNVDKGMLIAGQSSPRVGGGKILQLMRILFSGHATWRYEGKRIDVDSLSEHAAKDWLRQNLRFVNPDRHILFQNELKQGSPELTGIFERKEIVANDTSVAAGYAPLTETEQLVLSAERYLNSDEFKEKYPETGEDVKVMAYRQDRALLMTVSLAFIDHLIPNSTYYFDRKEEIRLGLEEHLNSQQKTLDSIKVMINMLDDPEQGDNGMYLTVLGTSAEGADGGQVGRGNRVNRLIAMNRAISSEAVAGKNPVSHVGKIYSVLSHRIAGEIYQQVPGINEVYVWLCSQIGQPVNKPLLASCQLSLQAGVTLNDIRPKIESVFENKLATIHEFTMEMAQGKVTVW